MFKVDSWPPDRVAPTEVQSALKTAKTMAVTVGIGVGILVMVVGNWLFGVEKTSAPASPASTASTASTYTTPKISVPTFGVPKTTAAPKTTTQPVEHSFCKSYRESQIRTADLNFRYRLECEQ